MRIYLVRHPQPEIGKEFCYGSTDLVVDPHELEKVLASLMVHLPKDALLFSSPLQRCAGLAQALAEHMTTLIKFDARLVEMNFGTWELRAWNDIPRAEIDAWAEDVVNYQPGGGECVLQMAQRVASFYQELCLHQQDSIVICHAGTIRLLLACHRGLTPLQMADFAANNSHQIGYGEIVTLACTVKPVRF
ncbi:histidine phosphatase family protein [Solimicrobium silvestre]|uniref:Fructose-26-bisphosphatase n=1 Tax=Solimicrobium silvestre TaxID=2099400 RepID=A0A2S9GV42_9BURK|nr:histidine phosphatase family protein [Solimicrobium silvestre]PRC91526.1 Fructose-26-bisphosphatase [Solimicrobium silvestre]